MKKKVKGNEQCVYYGCKRERFIETVRYILDFYHFCLKKKESKNIMQEDNHFLDDEKLLGKNGKRRLILYVN